MTFEQCHAAVQTLRQKQGTPCPLVRVDYAGTVIRGRLTRSDSDRKNGERVSPYGILTLEHLGLSRGPETILQIANIPQDGIHELDHA
jgi:hypothetical protein